MMEYWPKWMYIYTEIPIHTCGNQALEWPLNRKTFERRPRFHHYSNLMIWLIHFEGTFCDTWGSWEIHIFENSILPQIWGFIGASRKCCVGLWSRQFMFRAHFPKRKMKAINMCQNPKGYLFGRRVHVLGSSLEEINKSIKRVSKLVTFKRGRSL